MSAHVPPAEEFGIRPMLYPDSPGAPAADEVKSRPSSLPSIAEEKGHRRRGPKPGDTNHLLKSATGMLKKISLSGVSATEIHRAVGAAVPPYREPEADDGGDDDEVEAGDGEPEPDHQAAAAPMQVDQKEEEKHEQPPPEVPEAAAPKRPLTKVFKCDALMDGAETVFDPARYTQREVFDEADALRTIAEIERETDKPMDLRSIQQRDAERQVIEEQLDALLLRHEKLKELKPADDLVLRLRRALIGNGKEYKESQRAKRRREIQQERAVAADIKEAIYKRRRENQQNRNERQARLAAAL